MTPSPQDDPKTLVSTDWLAKHLRDPDLRVLDASWYLPAQNRDAKAEYADAHLPGARRQEVRLDDPALGLHVRGVVWREMYDFSPDCVLMVLASQHYDESDYIRDYPSFMAAVKGAEA